MKTSTKLEMHGKSKISEYKTWERMKCRCNNKNHNRYHRYGGRGIIVCVRWKNSFIAFFEDMGNKPFLNAQIDRINNDGNYEPDNCEWVTHLHNTQHTSTTKLTMGKARKIRLLYKDNSITYKKIAEMYNVDSTLIGYIIRNVIWKEIS